MTTTVQHPPVSYVQNLPVPQRRFIQDELETADRRGEYVAWEYDPDSDSWEIHTAGPVEIQTEFDQWGRSRWNYESARHWLVLYGFPPASTGGNAVLDLIAGVQHSVAVGR